MIWRGVGPNPYGSVARWDVLDFLARLRLPNPTGWKTNLLHAHEFTAALPPPGSPQIIRLGFSVFPWDLGEYCQLFGPCHRFVTEHGYHVR